MTCEGKELKTLSDTELLEAKASHEITVLNSYGKSDNEKMHEEEDLALSIVREMFRRTEESPSMQFIRKSLEERSQL